MLCLRGRGLLLPFLLLLLLYYSTTVEEVEIRVVPDLEYFKIKSMLPSTGQTVLMREQELPHNVILLWKTDEIVVFFKLS